MTIGTHLRQPAAVTSQRGAVLLFALIALVVMLIAAAALVRSFTSSVFAASNTGLKRNMQNQSERAVDKVLTEFRAGGPLSTLKPRGSDLAGSNYSATMLPSNAQGLPEALTLSDPAFDSVYRAADLVSDDQSVKIRYVVDRLCGERGDENTLGFAACVLIPYGVTSGTGSTDLRSSDRAAPCPPQPSVAPGGIVYRLSIRVTGPRHAQSFFQSTFSVPMSTSRDASVSAESTRAASPETSPFAAVSDAQSRLGAESTVTSGDRPTLSRITGGLPAMPDLCAPAIPDVRRLNWREVITAD